MEWEEFFVHHDSIWQALLTVLGVDHNILWVSVYLKLDVFYRDRKEKEMRARGELPESGEDEADGLPDGANPFKPLDYEELAKKVGFYFTFSVCTWRPVGVVDKLNCVYCWLPYPPIRCQVRIEIVYMILWTD